MVTLGHTTYIEMIHICVVLLKVAKVSTIVTVMPLLYIAVDDGFTNKLHQFNGSYILAMFVSETIGDSNM